MKLRFVFFAMITALCVVGISACDSDEPNSEADTETPEPPIGPSEPDEPTFPTGPAEPLTDEIRPVLTDGKKWVRKVVKRDPTQNYYWEGRVDGDTVKSGMNAKIIKSLAQNGQEKVDVLMREENGVVYELWGGKEFKYAYDVNPQQGIVFVSPPTGLSILSRGTIVLMGKTRRAAMVECVFNSFTIIDYWVEGIGPLFGSTVMHYEEMNSTILFSLPLYAELLECYDGNEKIYDYREFKPELYTPEVVFEEKIVIEN